MLSIYERINKIKRKLFNRIYFFGQQQVLLAENPVIFQDMLDLQYTLNTPSKNDVNKIIFYSNTSSVHCNILKCVMIFSFNLINIS